MFSVKSPHIPKDRGISASSTLRRILGLIGPDYGPVHSQFEQLVAPRDPDGEAAFAELLGEEEPQP
jgi:hypothetical protein